MALSNLGLGFVFTATDQASPVMQRLEKNFGHLDKSTDAAQRATERATTQMAAGTALLAGATFGLSKAFEMAAISGQFESRVTAAGKVAGATADEMERIKQASLQAGIDTQFDPMQAADALGALAQNGLTLDEALKTLTPTLNFASASLGQLNPEEAAGIASQAMKAFGVDADGLTLALDQMAKAGNFSALSFEDLPLALGTVSRGSQALKQDLDETMITMGLVKNIVPRVETAATAAAVAMERLAKGDVQKTMKGLGVDVVDAQGNFRDFLDIMVELSAATEGMSESKKTATLTDIFGTEGMKGAQAILTQLENGMKDAEGNIVKGAEAVAFLRKQMDTAGGTAQDFADAMLNTWEGKMTLLKGSMMTFKIVMGEAYREAMKPFIDLVTKGLNLMIETALKVNPQFRAIAARIVLITSSVAGLTGAIVVARAAMKLFGITSAGVMRTFLPLLALTLAITAATEAFRFAYENNIGGFADKVDQAVTNTKLAFKSLINLFTKGEISGALADELLNNPAVFSFVEQISMMVADVQRFIRGFSLNIDFEFSRITSYIEFATGAWLKAAGGFIEGASAAFELLRPVIQFVIDAFMEFAEQVTLFYKDILDSLGIADKAGEGWRMFGQVLGFVNTMAIAPLIASIGFLFKVMKMFMRIIRVVVQTAIAYLKAIPQAWSAMVDIFNGDIAGGLRKFASIFKAIFAPLVTFMDEIANGIVAGVEAALDKLAELAAMLPDDFRPDFLNEFISSRQKTATGGAFSGLAEAAEAARNSSEPTVAAAQAAADQHAQQQFMKALAPVGKAAGGLLGMPNVNLFVDGKRIAAAVTAAQRADAALGFGATPSLGADD